MPTSFQRLQEQALKMLKHLHEISGLDETLLSNLIIYAKLLTKPENPDEIDQLIFTTQMLKQFEFTSPTMLSLMYAAIKKPKAPQATVEEFCRLLIVFLTDDLDMKINYVFNVYDLNGDGELSFIEMYYFLKPCVITNEAEDIDSEEAVRELIEIVMKVTDLDENGAIDPAEFRRLVKSDVLYLQLLGPCLPPEHAINNFRDILTHNNEIEIRKIFAHERQFAMEKDTSFKYYPIKLDLP